MNVKNERTALDSSSQLQCYSRAESLFGNMEASGVVAETGQPQKHTGATYNLQPTILPLGINLCWFSMFMEFLV